MILSNLEWLSDIFNNTKPRAICLRQLNFLLDPLWPKTGAAGGFTRWAIVVSHRSSTFIEIVSFLSDFYKSNSDETSSEWLWGWYATKLQREFWIFNMLDLFLVSSFFFFFLSFHRILTKRCMNDMNARCYGVTEWILNIYTNWPNQVKRIYDSKTPLRYFSWQNVVHS